jgi:hypothetical protein
MLNSPLAAKNVIIPQIIHKNFMTPASVGVHSFASPSTIASSSASGLMTTSCWNSASGSVFCSLLFFLLNLLSALT